LVHKGAWASSSDERLSLFLDETITNVGRFSSEKRKSEHIREKVLLVDVVQLPIGNFLPRVRRTMSFDEIMDGEVVANQVGD
jgi:hypothetical protein